LNIRSSKSEELAKITVLVPFSTVSSLSGKPRLRETYAKKSSVSARRSEMGFGRCGFDAVAALFATVIAFRFARHPPTIETKPLESPGLIRFLPRRLG
jgi:hypothetical protein